MMLRWTCALCGKSLSDQCPAPACKQVQEQDCPFATAICGHSFHFHCVVEYCKDYKCPEGEERCPRDQIRLDIVRLGTRFTPGLGDDIAPPSCHVTHMNLAHLINRYRVVRVPGKYDPATHALLCGIQGHLLALNHSFADVMGNVISRLPEGGMM